MSRTLLEGHELAWLTEAKMIKTYLIPLIE